MRQLFLVALMALVFTSCKKDDSTTDPVTASKRLKKITKTENGTVTVYNLLYDGDKRLSSIKTTDNSEQILFTYDGSGNLVKIDETEEMFHNIYNYTYSNNLPVGASFKSWEKHPGGPDELIEDDVLTYTVASGNVTGIHLKMSDGTETDFALSYTNGNLTKVNTVGTNFYTATFTWGTKKSPYPQATKYILDQAGFSLLFAAKNEMLTTVYDFPGTTLDMTITNQYTYDSDGYPITSNDGDSELKFEYE
jgi:hypothetical protein